VVLRSFVFIKFVTSKRASEERVMYPFLCSLKSGELAKIKQCMNNKCDLFFIGRKNQLWCTDRCGAKVRAKRKRNEDKKKKYSY
jgi:hypothetical protein